MDKSLENELAEYMRMSNALEEYCRRIPPQIGPGPHQELSESQRLLSDLYYYWSAALMGNGDVFGYVDFIIEHKADFIAIGADGTLKALGQLMPYYEQQQKLKDEGEKGEYWWRTRDQRASAEELAEDSLDFGRLLLAYAKKNLRK